jgi:hypothetical protein
MSEIQSISERASFVENENELSIVISSAINRTKAKNIGIIFFLWLIGGIVIGVNYFRIEDHNTKIFILVWLAFWAYFSYVIGKAFFWQWSGKELIKIRSGKLIYKKDVNGRGWVMDYDLEKISKMRKYGEKTPGWLQKFGGDYWSVDCDSLAFDYEGKEVAIGYKLSEKESDRILKLLRGKFIPAKK